MDGTKKRAAKGGEVGTNGEFYAGGTFLPSTKLGKTAARGRGPGGVRRCRIEPCVWVELAEGQESIYALNGSMVRFDGDVMVPNPAGVAYRGETYHGHAVTELCEAYNSGIRVYERR